MGKKWIKINLWNQINMLQVWTQVHIYIAWIFHKSLINFQKKYYFEKGILMIAIIIFRDIQSNTHSSLLFFFDGSINMKIYFFFILKTHTHTENHIFIIIHFNILEFFKLFFMSRLEIKTVVCHKSIIYVFMSLWWI